MTARTTAQRSWRTPRQERSRHTVECVLAAATQVFAEHGYANTTTNHIAARAGVSIGSLYQYFPSKDALLMALAERHVERAFATVMEQVRARRDAPVPEFLRALVAALVEAHQIEPRLHRVIFEEARLDAAFRRRLDELDARAMAVARELIDQRIADLSVRNPEMASFIVVQVLEGLTHAMVTRHPKVLRTPEFRDEFVRLLESYLLGGSPARRMRARGIAGAAPSAPAAGRLHAAGTAPTGRRLPRPSGRVR
jgi:AcrR family transcriptional regulator